MQQKLPSLEVLDQLDRTLERRATCTQYSTFLNRNQEVINVINDIGGETYLDRTIDPSTIWFALRRLIYNVYHFGNEYLRHFTALKGYENEAEKVNIKAQAEQFQAIRDVLIQQQG